MHATCARATAEIIYPIYIGRVVALVGGSRAEYTLNLDKCWVVEDILAWLALCKNKTKLFKIVFIVGEPV